MSLLDRARAVLSFFAPDPEEASEEAIAKAYVLLLRMPHSKVRLRNQALLCTTRDALASELGASAQEVQDEFEYYAAHGRPSPRAFTKPTTQYRRNTN